MKKIISIIAAACFCVLCTMSVLAANPAKLTVKIDSQTDKEVIVSVNYLGGAEFACMDFQLSVNNDKLSLESSENGNGLKTFRDEVENAGGMIMAASKINGDVVNASLATTVSYKNVNGSDLFIVKLKKLNSEKIKSDDIKLKITNCQTLGFKDVDTTVSFVEVDGTESTQPQISTTDSKTTVSGNNSKNDESVNSNSELQSGSNSTQNNSQSSAANGEETSTKTEADNNSSTKNIILIVCLSVLALVVCAVIIVFIIKKKKNKSDNN